MMSDVKIAEIEYRGNDLARSLESMIEQFGSVVVGFSGGVDSSVVAAAAARALGNRALAVTAVTESITPEDCELADAIAAQLDLNHRRIEYSELALEHYAENPANRCFYCKDGLYTQLDMIAREESFSVILDGTNADDAGDYRPGREAATAHNVRSPLLELGITKEEVRQLAHYYGLPNQDKPSAPCLSSRVPYGTVITKEVLDQIGDAERRLRRLGFSELRVRHHNETARIELPRDEFSLAIEQADEITNELREAGYRYVALDLAGFRSGSLNEGLVQIALPGGN